MKSEDVVKYLVEREGREELMDVMLHLFLEKEEDDYSDILEPDESSVKFDIN